MLQVMFRRAVLTIEGYIIYSLFQNPEPNTYTQCKSRLPVFLSTADQCCGPHHHASRKLHNVTTLVSQGKYCESLLYALLTINT